MSATLTRPETAAPFTERSTPHLDFGRSNAGYGFDPFGDTDLFVPTDVRPHVEYRLVIQSVAATDLGRFADDAVLLPPVHRQQMRLQIRESRVGELLPETADE